MIRAVNLSGCDALESLPDLSALEACDVKGTLPGLLYLWEYGGRKAWDRRVEIDARAEDFTDRASPTPHILEVENLDSSPANPALLLYALLYECMFRVCACNYHSYTHVILALGIVREPKIWGFMTSQAPAHMALALGG